jgi:hypothetical protein
MRAFKLPPIKLLLMVLPLYGDVPKTMAVTRERYHY